MFETQARCDAGEEVDARIPEGRDGEIGAASSAPA